MNIHDPNRNMPVGSILVLEAHSRWFNELLGTQRIIPVQNSPFAHSLLNMQLLVDAYRSGHTEVVPDANFPIFMQETLGTDFMIRAFHRMGEETTHRLFAGRWQIFSGTDICLTRDAPDSQERNTVWELITAALCNGFTTNVTISEPDVQCIYQNAKWGIACKVLHTQNPQRQIDRIIEGVRQIEGSDSDLGVVAVNITNQIDHSSFFGNFPGRSTSTFFSFNSPGDALGLLSSRTRDFAECLNTNQLNRRITQDRDGNLRTKTRAILYFAQAVAVISRVPTLVSNATWHLVRTIDVGQEAFLTALNNSAQEILAHSFDAHSSKME